MEIAYEQAKAVLSALKRSRVRNLLLLLFSNIVTGYFIAAHYTDLPLMIGGCLLLFFNITGIAGNIMQMMLITQQQDYWEHIGGPYKQTGLLQTAVLLQAVMIRFTRVRLLGWPLYSVYVMMGCWFIGWKVDRSWLAGMAILVFPVSLYLYNKVRYKNLHIKWVKELLNWSGRKYLLKMMGAYPAA